MKENNLPDGTSAGASATDSALPGMISNPLYDGPLYEIIGESKPHFDSLPQLTRAPESYYVEIAGGHLLTPSPDAEAPLLGAGFAERLLSNGAAANSCADEDYTVMKPAKPESFIR